MIEYKVTFKKSDKKANVFCRSMAKVEALKETTLSEDKSKITYLVGFDSKYDIPSIIEYIELDKDVFIEKIKSIKGTIEDLLLDYYPSYGISLFDKKTIQNQISKIMDQNNIKIYTIITPHFDGGAWVISWFTEDKPELGIETYVFYEEIFKS